MRDHCSLGTHLSTSVAPSWRAESSSSNSCRGGSSAASEKPRLGRLVKSFTLRGPLPLLSAAFMSRLWSLTAALAQPLAQSRLQTASERPAGAITLVEGDVYQQLLVCV